MAENDVDLQRVIALGPGPAPECCAERKSMQDLLHEQLRQQLRDTYRIRSNAKRISKQVCSQLRMDIKAACTARIHEIEAELKRSAMASATRPLSDD